MRQPETVYSHHIFAMFLAHLAKHPSLAHTQEDQDVAREPDKNLLSDPNISRKIISIFTEAGLGTEEEAKVCMIPSITIGKNSIPLDGNIDQGGSRLHSAAQKGEKR